MSYGELKIDTITFTAGGVDASVSVSGLVQNPTFTGNITTTGTISGDVVKGNTVSGATVTGDAGEFGTITGNTAGFTTVTGTTVTGTTANFVTVSGTTVTGNIGLFTTITGGIHTLTSGVFASGTAANPSITFVDDLDTGLFTGAANTVSLVASGVAVLTVSGTNVGVGTSAVDAALHVQTNISSGNGTELLLQNTYSIPGNDFTGNTIRFRLNDNDGTYDQAFLKAVTNENFGRTSVLAFGVSPSNSTDATEKMRLTSTGLGLGTSNPQGTLNVQGSTAAPSLTYDTANLVNLDAGTIQLAIGVNSSAPFGAYLQGRDSSDGARIISLNPAGGNVGIGTTSPAELLHVVNPSTTANVRISGGSTAATYSNLSFYGGTTKNAEIYANSSFFGLTASNSNPIRFDTGGSESARIDTSNRLLIGTTSSLQSDAPLQVKSGGGANVSLYMSSDAATAGSRISFLTDGGATAREQARIFGQQTTTGAGGGYLTFSTTDDGASSPTERMRIISAGRVGIGTTSPIDPFEVKGSSGIQMSLNTPSGAVYTQLSFRNNDTQKGAIWWNNSNNLLGNYVVSGGQHVWYIDTEKMRLDANGRLLVGTSSASGTTSNVAQVIAGNYTSFTGSVSAAHSTATTLFNLDNLSASYIVTAMITGTASANNYTAVYMIATVTSNSRVIQAIRAGALLTLSLSGGDVQATQSSGITQTIKWSVTRLANL
jgi:hypothetical protein